MPDEIDEKLDVIEDGMGRLPVLVGLVIDQSGSMIGMREATIVGLNEFLQAQRQEQGDVTLLVTMFDTVPHLGSAQTIAEIADFDEASYRPDGMTALYDAIGLTVKQMSDEPKMNGTKMVLCIVTDGLENSSKEYTRSQVRDLLQDKQDAGWTVVYLAANQDAFEVAGQMGVQSVHTANYVASAGGTHAVYNTMSNVVTRHATGQSTHITEDELIALAQDDEH